MKSLPKLCCESSIFNVQAEQFRNVSIFSNSVMGVSFSVQMPLLWLHMGFLSGCMWLLDLNGTFRLPDFPDFPDFSKFSAHLLICTRGRTASVHMSKYGSFVQLK